MIEIRTITADERAASKQMGDYAFGNWHDDDVQPDDLAWIDPNTTVGLFVDGVMAAKLVHLPVRQVIRGVIKPMGGIAGVATDPAHRRRGFVRQLLQHTFKAMQEEGQVVSALYPFRESFYARFGYVTTTNQLQVQIPTQALAHLLPLARFGEDAWTIERRPAKEMKQQVLHTLPQFVTAHHGFTLFHDELPDSLWARIVKDHHLLLLRQDGRLRGMMLYKSSSFLQKGEIKVREWYWDAPAARDRLLGYLALHADGHPMTWLPVPYGVNFHAWLHDPAPPLEVKLGPMPITLMGRVMDVAGALADLPMAVPGTVTFAYEDAHCPWQNGRYRLTAADGRLQATPTNETAAASLTTAGLSALVYGALPLAEVVHRGWAAGFSDAEQALLHAWFPPQPAFNLYPF